MFEIWAFITGQKVVYLKDHDGEITKTVAKKTPFGFVAKRHWPFHIRDVLLLPGGKVENGKYVVEWREKTPNGGLECNNTLMLGRFNATDAGQKNTIWLQRTLPGGIGSLAAILKRRIGVQIAFELPVVNLTICA